MLIRLRTDCRKPPAQRPVEPVPSDASRSRSRIAAGPPRRPGDTRRSRRPRRRQRPRRRRSRSRPHVAGDQLLAQVRLADLVVAEQVLGGVLQDDRAGFDDVAAVGPRSGPCARSARSAAPSVPWSLISLMIVEDLLHEHRRQAHRGLVEHQQVRVGSSAPGRSPASAARPPRAFRRAARSAA